MAAASTAWMKGTLKKAWSTWEARVVDVQAKRGAVARAVQHWSKKEIARVSAAASAH